MVPELLARENENNQRKIISRWLDVLNDPVTNVIPDETQSPAQTMLKTEFTKDSILIVTISGSGNLDDFEKIGGFIYEVKNLLNTSTKVFGMQMEDNFSVSDYNLMYLCSQQSME